MMMYWTLPMRQMCHKAVCPCLLIYLFINSQQYKYIIRSVYEMVYKIEYFKVILSLDISTTDGEDTRKCKARELAHKGDIEFTAWKDKCISEGVKGIQE